MISPKRKQTKETYALFERNVNSPIGTKWKRTFPNAPLLTRDKASEVYQSYLLSHVLPGEDGDLKKKYMVGRVR